MSKCRVCYLPVGALIGGCSCSHPTVYAPGERAAEVARIVAAKTAPAPAPTAASRKSAPRGSYRPRARKACITGGQCSSFGAGHSCGGHDCDGWS